MHFSIYICAALRPPHVLFFRDSFCKKVKILLIWLLTASTRTTVEHGDREKDGPDDLVKESERHLGKILPRVWTPVPREPCEYCRQEASTGHNPKDTGEYLHEDFETGNNTSY